MTSIINLHGINLFFNLSQQKMLGPKYENIFKKLLKYLYRLAPALVKISKFSLIGIGMLFMLGGKIGISILFTLKNRYRYR